MIRRISTKWVLAVLAAVVVPFVGFAYFVNTKVSSRLAGDVVRYHLLSLAGDLAGRIDEEIGERRRDAELLASDPILEWFVTDAADRSFAANLEKRFNLLVQRVDSFDLVVAVDAEGRYAVSNARGKDGEALPAHVLDALRGRDYSSEPWFQAAMRDGSALVDCHTTPLLDPGATPHVVGTVPGPLHLGFGHRIQDTRSGGQPAGVVFLLMNWQHIESEVSQFGVRRLQQAGRTPAQVAVGEDIYASSYAWIWRADADTIIAHPRRELYGRRVSVEPVALPQMVESARASAWGMYPDYSFRGVPKKAAFKHCRGGGEGGFGWVVGVGIDNADIYAPVRQLQDVLYGASAVVLLIVVCWTIMIARRTTRPILKLSEHTRRIAGGDLDARIDLGTQDELGALAEDFNYMTIQLKENREQLVKAEKDAAWREMARQVAHEIKNPLTPISLGAGLLKRAHDEGSDDFDDILDRTILMIQRQVENMREIAHDFHAFAGEHKKPQVVDLGQLIDEVLDLNSSWVESQGIEVRRAGAGGIVRADPGELRRALVNLVHNALEAMPDGGVLAVNVAGTLEEVVLELRDSGHGIDPEVEERLFEPYLTTRSSGTGLGLAIVRRVVEDLGGHVELENAPDGTGAIARVTLPRTS
ncbi:MAG: signal transduction histidine kinase [Chlamydiales bacterium]|jgi:signal transduction histidine kinase